MANMLFKRALEHIIKERLIAGGKGVVVYGARQVGKTTLVSEIVSSLKLRVLTINADQGKFLDALSSRDLGRIQGLVVGYDLLFIDEAQRIPDIGVNLKIILDSLKDLKLVVTGSSSLDLASKISEPLTGRVWTYRLYPISFLELSKIYNRAELDAQLPERLIFGSYPEIFSYSGNEQRREYLQNLSDAYLYRDLIEFGNLKNSSKIRDLLKLLAFQIGSQVSLSELGKTLGMSKDTVAKYIDYLEKSFVIFRLSGFSRNLRKEVSKMDKIYFWDLGARNILIDDLKEISSRNDVGQLWENFLTVERIKTRAYLQKSAGTYFWRTHTGAELDLIEEKDEQLTGFEFKWSEKKVKSPHSWQETYQGAKFQLVNHKNYLDFILDV